MSDIVFPFAPDWSVEVVETHQWVTDVLVARDGGEQRIALRTVPYCRLGFTVLTRDALESARLETLLLGGQAERFLLPVWTDGQVLDAPVSPGVTDIPCVTDGYEFAPDEPVLLWLSHERFETVLVAQVENNSLTLQTGTSQAWPTGTQLLPLRQGRLSASQKLTRLTDHHLSLRLDFTLEDHPGLTPIDPGPGYAGFQVLTLSPNWVDDLDVEFVRTLERLDNPTGVDWQTDPLGYANTLQSFHWLLAGRAQIAALRAWLYARRGRAVPFWSASPGSDLSLIAPINAADTSIEVRYIGYAHAFPALLTRRDIALTTVTGDTFYRRIIAATAIDASRERLTLDAPLGITLSPDQIRSLRFLTFTRLESDTQEIHFVSPILAQASALLRGIVDIPAGGTCLVQTPLLPTGDCQEEVACGHLIGLLPGGTYSFANAVSADGAVVAGYGDTPSGDRAYRWTAANGLVTLALLPGSLRSYALAVSADATTVVGSCYLSEYEPQAVRWTGNGVESLGLLPDGTYSYATAVSANGAVVVGNADTPLGMHAFRWTAAEGMVDLGSAWEEVQTSATGVSADGSVVVGDIDDGEAVRAYRWTAANGIVDLGVLPEGVESYATAVSADGAVVVGYGTFPEITDRAFRWTAIGGMQELSALPEEFGSHASAVSADGSVIVGSVDTLDGIHAFRWTAADGLVDIGACPETPVSYSSGVSASGRVVVGIVTPDLNDPQGNRAFRWTFAS